MKAPRFIWTVLLVSWLPAPLAAELPLEVCFERLRVEPRPASGRDLVSVTVEGLVDYCSSVRVAAVGDAAALGPPFEYDVNIILGVRKHDLPPGVSCPAAEVPYTLTAHLPQPFAPRGLNEPSYGIGLFIRVEDAEGTLVALRRCQDTDVAVHAHERDRALLHANRFRVEAGWRTAESEGLGFVVPAAHQPPVDSTLFWFFAPENWEVMVKVLDGCAVNGHWWVLGAASTDVEFTLRITDTATGAIWQHKNQPGTLAPAFADIEAFNGCAGAGGLP